MRSRCATAASAALVSSSSSAGAAVARAVVSLPAAARQQSRCIGSLRDAATRAVVGRALDSLSSGATPTRRELEAAAERGRANAASATDSDVEQDALTWKSVVDRPVVANVDDSLTAEQLYPVGAPQWPTPEPLPSGPGAGSASASAASSSSFFRSAFGFAGDAASQRPASGAAGVAASTHAGAGAGAAAAGASAFSSSASSASSASAAAPYDESADHLDLSAFPGVGSVDPFVVAAPDLANINANIKALLGIDHPVLETVARYFFVWDGGKKVRPTLVMLMAHAVNAHVASGAVAGVAASAAGYTPTGKFSLSGPELREGQRRAAAGIPALVEDGEGERPAPLPAQVALPLQRRLAEIAELIHTASLLHDDVIDGADTRRGAASVNKAFGNKLAVLAGDFLLARASVCLARLRNVPTVELLSTVIEHLVKGEVMQMRNALRSSDGASRAAFDMYLRKTYYKTGSLMANACRAVGLLGCYPEPVCDAAFRFGMHLGIAFQLIDDLLDYSGTDSSLGKPALNDLKQGLATAPVLYAAHRFPSLLPLIERKFDSPGDVEAALRCITASDSLSLTRRLAVAHGNMALDAIKDWSPSPARTALAALVSRVLNRDR